MEYYFKNKHVLITGGLGFLGSTLAQQLVGAGAIVTVIDNLDPLYGGNLFNVKEIDKRIRIVIDDIRNTEVMTALVANADIIFHLAAQVSYIDSINIPFDDLDLNARTTLHILECCRKLNPQARVIFSSSRMIYGKVEGSIVTENSPTNP